MRLAIDVEAEEIRWAIHTMAGFGYTKVILQTDSMLLKKMLNGEEEIWPKLKPIIQEIQTSAARNREFEEVYYPRSGNKTIDRIANETDVFTSIVPKLYLSLWLKSCLEADKLFVRH